MAATHESRTLRLVTNHTNEAGKSVTENLNFTGIDPEASESMMWNFSRGVEEVSSDTLVARKYKDLYNITDDVLQN